MIHRLLLLAALLFAGPASAQTNKLVCDGYNVPVPVLCYGMKLQKTGFAGNVIQVYNPVNVTVRDIGFTASGDLDTTALDGFLGGFATTTGIVSLWADQVSSVALVADTLQSRVGTVSATLPLVTNLVGGTAGLTNIMAMYGSGIQFSTILSNIDSPTQLTLNQVQLTNGPTQLFFTDAPAIRDHTIGGARSIIVQGANMSGAVFGLTTAIDLSGLAITAKDYSISAVVRFTSSMFLNQAGAPGLWRGLLAELFNGSSGVVARVFNDSRSGNKGSIYISDQGGLDFWNDKFVPVQPVVLTITSRTGVGVQVCVNNECAGTGFNSALVRTATKLLLGKTSSGTPGPVSDSGGFSIVSLNVWNVGLTPSEAAFHRAQLASLYSIDMSTNRYDRNFVGTVGDSIASGYTVLDLQGYMMYLQPLLSQPSAVASYGVPGSTVGVNPFQLGIMPTSTVELATPALCGTLSKFTKSKVVLVHGGGNDALIGFTARSGTTTSGNATITGIASTADINIGDFVYAFNIPALATVLSKTANSITITGSLPNTSGVQTLVITLGTITPTYTYNAIASTVAQARACGATNVLVVPVLKRDAIYQKWVEALNTLIVAGVPNASIADCRNFGQLGNNPSVDYFDSGHLSEPGNLDMANCLAPFINPLLQP